MITDRYATPARLVGALAIPLLVAAGGCAGEPAPPAPPYDPPQATATESAPDVPATGNELVQACEPDITYADSAPYTGDGPHPIALFEHDSFRGLIYQDGDAEDPADFQLVGCMTRVPEPDGFPCGVYRMSNEIFDYTGSESLSIHRIRYEIEIYEVATGRQIDTVSVVGTEELECPERIFPSRLRRGEYQTDVPGLDMDMDTMTLTRDPTRDEVLDALGDLVTGPAR